MQQRKIFIILTSIIALGFILAGCGSETGSEGEAKDPTSLTAGTEIDSGQLFTYGNILGQTDEEVIATLGEGEPAYIRGDEAEAISARLYQKNILGFNGETVLDYDTGDPPRVEEVLITFSGATFGDVVDVITQQLGEVIMIERTEKENAEAVWAYEDITFDLTYYGGTLLLSIKQNI